MAAAVDTLPGFTHTGEVSTHVWKWLLISAAVSGTLFLLDRLLLRFEARGWIYYRKKQATPGSIGNACLSIQSILQPENRSVIEAKEERRSQQDQGSGPKDASK